MKKKLIIFGTGTLAEIAYFYFANDSDYEVVGFTSDKSQQFYGDFLLEKPVYTWDQLLTSYEKEEIEIFVAIGYRKTNQVRRERFDQVKQAGFKLANYISSRAINYSKKIGENCFILENNVLQPFCEVGDCVTMWSGNHLGHHSVVGDNCFITSHVVISGKCIIGSNTFIGVNSSLHDNVHVGKFCVIGAGSIVSESCEDRTVFLPSKSEKRTIKRDII